MALRHPIRPDFKTIKNRQQQWNSYESLIIVGARRCIFRPPCHGTDSSSGGHGRRHLHAGAAVLWISRQRLLYRLNGHQRNPSRHSISPATSNRRGVSHRERQQRPFAGGRRTRRVPADQHSGAWTRLSRTELPDPTSSNNLSLAIWSDRADAIPMACDMGRIP